MPRDFSKEPYVGFLGLRKKKKKIQVRRAEIFFERGSTEVRVARGGREEKGEKTKKRTKGKKKEKEKKRFRQGGLNPGRELGSRCSNQLSHVSWRRPV